MTKRIMAARAGAMLAVAGVALLAAGCGGNDNTTAPGTTITGNNGGTEQTLAQRIVGNYRLTSISGPGVGSTSCPGTLSGVSQGITFNASCGANDTITLNADNTGQITYNGVATSGTYTLSGTTLTLTGSRTSTTPVVTRTATVSLSSDNNTLTAVFSGDPGGTNPLGLTIVAARQ